MTRRCKSTSEGVAIGIGANTEESFAYRVISLIFAKLSIPERIACALKMLEKELSRAFRFCSTILAIYACSAGVSRADPQKPQEKITHPHFMEHKAKLELPHISADFAKELVKNGWDTITKAEEKKRNEINFGIKYQNDPKNPLEKTKSNLVTVTTRTWYVETLLNELAKTEIVHQNTTNNDEQVLCNALKKLGFQPNYGAYKLQKSKDGFKKSVPFTWHALVRREYKSVQFSHKYYEEYKTVRFSQNEKDAADRLQKSAYTDVAYVLYVDCIGDGENGGMFLYAPHGPQELWVAAPFKKHDEIGIDGQEITADSNFEFQTLRAPVYSTLKSICRKMVTETANAHGMYQ